MIAHPNVPQSSPPSFPRRRLFVLALAGIWLCTLAIADPVLAQRRDGNERNRRNRQSRGQQIQALRVLDRNGDGQLDPREVPPQERAIITRLAAIANLDASRPLPIEQLEAAVANLARQGNQGNSGTQQGDSGLLPPLVPGFGNGNASTFVPGFGTGPEIVTREDIQLAQETLERFDRDDDGQLDEREMRRLRLRGDEMQFDKNGNDGIDEIELATALAMQRALGREFDPDSDDDDDRDRDRDDDDRRRRRDRDDDDDERDRERDRLREISRLRAGVMDRHDIDGDGFLSPLECKLAGHDINLTDTDGDEQVSAEELDDWIQESYPESERDQPQEYDLPEWFLLKDRNGDNQVVMAEFETRWTNEKAAEFDSYDTNSDGRITREEIILASRKGDYQNNSAMVIPADGIMKSELIIDDRFYLADLDVHLSITHSRDEDLDIFLISPDGVRVELACGVGGADDHFEGTIIDAEARIEIDNNRQARPPFAGRFAPSRRFDELDSLDDLYDRDEPANAQGVWTLLIDTAGSDRPGILHRWALTTQQRD